MKSNSKFFIVCLLALIFGGFSSSYSKELRYPDIKQTMQKMFAYHVENKSFSPLVVKRSFKIYLEQFDPDRLYLLKSEVDAFINLSQRDVNWVIHQYHQDEYEEYVKMDLIIQKAILRHRAIRAQIVTELLEQEQFQSVQDERYSDFAKSEAELKRRMKKKMVKLLSLRQKRSENSLNSNRKVKIVALLEKRLKRHESGYIPEGLSRQEYETRIEHLRSLHILKSLAKSLDAHTAYYDEEEAVELRTALKKQFHGIGVILREGEDGIYVADLITGGPAYNSKEIVVGDLLLEINGMTLEEASFEDVLEKLKGDVGTSVKLTLKNRSGKDSRKVSLKREKIILNQERLSYSYEPYADGVIGKITLPGFYDNGEGVNAEKDLREAIKELKSKGHLYGLVIDMRENSGGFLTQAVKIAGLFITNGVVVISKYADGEIRYMRDLDGKMYYQGPLLLLTSKASASAAEIVAQALQDYGAALVVGDERTYGKGSMQYQTVTEENSKAFFKVTVGRYYTVSGRSTQIEGVIADIVVPTVFSPYKIGERYLEYPLSSDQLDLRKSFEDNAKQNYRSFPKRQLPYLYRKDTTWTSMLPTLKANSQKRLAKNEDFQCFLKKIHGKKCSTASGKSLRQQKRASDHGVDDLHVRECVLILKDMIYLKSQKTSEDS